MSLTREGKRMNETLSQLQIKGDVYTRQMVMERKRIADLNEALVQADRQVTAFQKKLQRSAVDVLNLHSFSNKKATTADGWNPAVQGIVSQKKMASILENRLNKLNIRLSQYDTENRQVKADIDQLRRRRLACNHNRRELEVKLKDIQQRVNAMLEASAQTSETQRLAIESRDKLVVENEEEANRFEENYVALGVYIDKQMKEFEESIQEAALAVKAQVEDSGAQRGDMSVTQEQNMKNRIAELAETIDDERRIARETQDKIDQFAAEYDALRDAAKDAAVAAGMSRGEAEALNDIDEIIKFYLKITDETFSVFTYNLEQIKETDGILERIEVIEQEHKKHEENMINDDAARAEIITDLKAQIQETKVQTKEYEESAKEAQKMLNLVAKRVQSLFYKIQCDQMAGNAKSGKKTQRGPRSDSHLLLTSGAGINESNILKFLELVEQRTVELIAEFTRKTRAIEHLQPPVLSLSPSKIRDILQPPDSKASDDDPELDADRPMPVHLLRQRTAERLVGSINFTPSVSKSFEAE